MLASAAQISPTKYHLLNIISSISIAQHHQRNITDSNITGSISPAQISPAQYHQLRLYDMLQYMLCTLRSYSTSPFNPIAFIHKLHHVVSVHYNYTVHKIGEDMTLPGLALTGSVNMTNDRGHWR